MSLKLERPSGSDVALVRVRGDKRDPEPTHVRIVFPGGNVDLARHSDGSYWVHVYVDRPNHGSFVPGETVSAEIVEARADYLERGVASIDTEGDLYHLAVLVRRTDGAR